MTTLDPYGEVVVQPIVDHRPRCWRCHRTLALYLTRPWSLRCHRCKADCSAGDPPPAFK